MKNENEQTIEEANAMDRWEATLPDEWDTHKLGGVTASGHGVCAEDCEACRFKEAVHSMPLTLWVGVAANGTPVFATRNENSARNLASDGWAGWTITVTKMEVNL